MRGTLATIVDGESEHTSYVATCGWVLEMSPTDSYAALRYGTHRIVTTNPDVIAFLRSAQNTAMYAHMVSVDDIPTDADLAYAILAEESPWRRPTTDLLPDIL